MDILVPRKCIHRTWPNFACYFADPILKKEPITDPWDERYTYLPTNWSHKNQLNVGKLTSVTWILWGIPFANVKLTNFCTAKGLDLPITWRPTCALGSTTAVALFSRALRWIPVATSFFCLVRSAPKMVEIQVFDLNDLQEPNWHPQMSFSPW